MSELIVDNTITRDYIGSDIDFKAYLDVDAISQSFLSKMHNSPAMALWERDHPKETDAMITGRIVHGMVLEPETYFNKMWFADHYAILPAGMRKDPRAKKYQEWLVDVGERTVIREKDLDNCSAIAGAVSSRIGPLSSGRAEITMFYKGKHFDFKARIDYLSSDDCIIDLKTTRSAHPASFKKSIENYGYDIQAAMYCYLYTRLTGKTIKEYKILAVEKEQPYISEMYTLSEGTLALGTQKLQEAIGLYDKYKDKDAYSVPGYRHEDATI